VAVWGNHLLPLLTGKEAVRLGCTCKALRGVVREHFTGDLGKIKLDKLQAALTAFPRAREVVLAGRGEKEALVEWLRGEGRGRHLARVAPASDFVLMALREGALPSLSHFNVHLQLEAYRAMLTGGFLGSMQELHVWVRAPQLAALGLVRQLPVLAKLEVNFQADDDDGPVEVEWPPFIPPSLKALRIDLTQNGIGGLSLLRALPGVLGASGAGLERLEVVAINAFENGGKGLVHMAQALRCCSRTLKGFILKTLDDAIDDDETEAYEDHVERLRVLWAEVLAGVSACRELEVLVLPGYIEVEPLFPPGTAFARLTHLEIADIARGRLPEVGVMGLWELMASGGLPALAKLGVTLGPWTDIEVRTRVAPALEAVAGTLTHLCLDRESNELHVGYQLGVAMGKLRLLKDLALDLSEDGQAYHAVAQGLAASGGDRPLPLLWRVWVIPRLRANADLLASLLLPSVRVLATSSHHTVSMVLLTACALRQAGYQHIWSFDYRPQVEEAVRAIAPLCRRGLVRCDDVWGPSCSW
jgi:hypothetical protein